MTTLRKKNSDHRLLNQSSNFKPQINIINILDCLSVLIKHNPMLSRQLLFYPMERGSNTLFSLLLVSSHSLVHE